MYKDVMKTGAVRKLTKTGDYSYYVTIPREFIAELEWRKKQKVVLKLVDKKIIIEGIDIVHNTSGTWGICDGNTFCKR